MSEVIAPPTPSLWELWVRTAQAETAPAAPEPRKRRSASPLGAPPAPLFIRLIEEATRACRRDGVTPSPAALAARIGARIGMPAGQVAVRLSRMAHIDAAPLAPVPGPEAARWRELAPLAEEILAERERQAFFARCLEATTPDRRAGDPAAAKPSGAQGLAAHFLAGHWRTEASARRKMTIALDRLGRGKTGQAKPGADQTG